VAGWPWPGLWFAYNAGHAGSGFGRAGHAAESLTAFKRREEMSKKVATTIKFGALVVLMGVFALPTTAGGLAEMFLPGGPNYWGSILGQ
jgi:hypothetical protein